MASSYSTRTRFTLQATGENNNTWGNILNAGVFQLMDDAIAGTVAFALSGNHVLTTANGATDEARQAILSVTGGTGGTITIPPVSKPYIVRNGASGPVTVTMGSGAVALFQPGETGGCFCDAANVYRVRPTDFGGTQITGVGAPLTPNSAVTKSYVDNLAFSAVDLPNQVGHANTVLTTDGTNSNWSSVKSPMLRDVQFIVNAPPASASNWGVANSDLTMRWTMGKNGASETGANAGSDFEIDRFNDAGASLGAALTINRASGAVAITAPGQGGNAGTLTIAPPSGNAIAVFNKPVGATWAALSIETSGSLRWSVAFSSNDLESGSNAGSNFFLDGFADDGTTYLGHYLAISRQNGNVALGGASSILTLGPLAGNASLALNKHSGTAGLANYIIGYANSQQRWVMGLGDSGSESGSNNGSDFLLYSYTDAGANLYAPITIKRGTGIVTFQFPIVNGSDRAMKRNIEPIRDALARVCKLQGVAFDRIGSNQREIGLIAQDVIDAVPEVVRETTYNLPDDASEDFKRLYEKPVLGIAYAQLTALLIEAVKQLAEQVKALEAGHA
jgi:hypothetical protein